MKAKSLRPFLLSAAAVALAAPLSLLAATPSPSPAVSPSPAFSPGSLGANGLDQRMEQLDNQLDSVFASTFRNFGSWFGPNELASSIDLRDQKDKYVARVYVPGSDTSKINARVDHNVLRVTAEGSEQSKNSSRSERYEQMVSLPGPVDASKMRIERKQNLVVINLPKAAGTMAAASPNPSATPSENNFNAFDQSIVHQMARMQGRMDQIFADAFPADGNLTNGFTNVQLGSAVHLDNQKNKYVVHFYLPEKNLQNVNVKLDKNQLRLTASETEKNKSNGNQSFESGDYEQLITLPGPVQQKGMKVERQNGTIVVTLPKAKA